MAKWLPLAFRICFAAVLWLVVAPYLTNCLYLGWIIKPSSILARQETILSDIVSGAVMGATIIISFLSLMSFADFLRVLWQQPQGGQPEGDDNEEEEQQQQAEGRDENAEEQNDEIAEADSNNTTDDRIIEFIERNKQNTNLEAGLKIDSDSTIYNATTSTTTTTSTSKSSQTDYETHLDDIDQIDEMSDGDDIIGATLRETNAELRFLATEREARRQNDFGERNLANGDDDDDSDKADGDVDQVLPLADNFIDIPRRNIENVEELDDDSDDGEVDENVDDNEEAWLDNEDDENDEDQVPHGGEPLDDGIGIFDQLDPALQDNEVVSVTRSTLIRFDSIQSSLTQFSHQYYLSLPIRIWKLMLRWTNYLAFEVR